MAQSEADRLRNELVAARASQEQLQTALAESELEVSCCLASAALICMHGSLVHLHLGLRKK